MRHLVACPACRRQFDATGRAPGAVFPCLCGRTVTVPAPRASDAAVVRCSSCGASRRGAEPQCAWCASAFTLVEQELHTICPQCLTRIGDRARYCHACGVAVAPQAIGEQDPARRCPVCVGSPPMSDRALPGGPALLECARCRGLWVSPGDLRALVARVAAEELGGAQVLLDVLSQPSASRGSPAPAQGPLYRACVTCGQRMNRTRFAGRTPVIIDYCREHGVWFDAEELSAALASVREGRSAGPGRSTEVIAGDAASARAAQRGAWEQAWKAEGPLPRDAWGFPPGLQGHGSAARGLQVLGAILRLFG